MIVVFSEVRPFFSSIAIQSRHPPSGDDDGDPSPAISPLCIIWLTYTCNERRTAVLLFLRRQYNTQEDCLVLPRLLSWLP